jgi:hypothetical protein
VEIGRGGIAFPILRATRVRLLFLDSLMSQPYLIGSQPALRLLATLAEKYKDVKSQANTSEEWVCITTFSEDPTKDGY